MAGTVVQQLVATLGVQVDQASINKALTGLGQVQNSLFNLKNLLFGTGAVFAAKAFVKAALFGDEMGDLADKLGIGVEEFQKLKFAADLSDVSFEDLQAGLRGLTRTAGEAGRGGGEALKAFSGIAFKNADGSLRGLDEILSSAADKVAGLSNRTEQGALAMQIFGKSGQQLVPLLAKGSKGIDALKKRAAELGIVLDTKAVRRSQEFDDSLKELKATFIGITGSIASAAVPAMKEFAERLTKTFQAARPFIQARLPDLIGFFGRMFEFAGRMIQLASEHLTAFSIILVILAAVFAPVTSALVLLGLVVDDLNVYLKGGDSLIGDFIKSLEEIDPAANKAETAVLKLMRVMFDLTSVDKWKDAGLAINDFFVSLARSIVSAIAVPFNALANIPIVGKVLGGIGQSVLGTVDKDLAGLQENLSGRGAQGALDSAYLANDILNARVADIASRRTVPVPMAGATPAAYDPNAAQRAVNNITINAPNADAKEVARIVEEKIQASYQPSLQSSVQ